MIHRPLNTIHFLQETVAKLAAEARVNRYRALKIHQVSYTEQLLQQTTEALNSVEQNS